MTAPVPDRPTAVPMNAPAPSASGGTQTPRSTAPGKFAATKDFSAGRPTRRPERRRGPGAPGLADLSRLLSERDIAVLEVILSHRFLTARHIERLLFHDHATAASGARACRRVLRRLEACGLLQRPLRRIGGLSAGSASSIWMVSSRGLRLLNMRAGVGAVGRVREPGERFVQHYLEIADAHLGLVEAQRAGRLELVEVQIEPACWRQFTGLGGSREVLKPDLFVVSAAMPAGGGKAAFEDHWFVEVDRGTESLPTLLRQCQLYENYRRQGSEQVERGVFPLVVWVVPDDVRAAKLQAALRAARDLDNELYRVVTSVCFVELICGGAA